MSDSGKARLEHTVRTDGRAVADAACAAQIRREFSELAASRHFALDATKTSDVVLAVNEAMANAAEFAYATAEATRRDACAGRL